MLDLQEKKRHLDKYLSIKNNSYGDIMKEEIHNYYFDLENDPCFLFLEKLDTINEIEVKVEFLVSKMIMHEHEDSLYNIIENYA